MAMDDEDGISRQERIKKLYDEEVKNPAGREAFKRRQILEGEYAREAPDEPLRGPLDRAFKRGQ